MNLFRGSTKMCQPVEAKLTYTYTYKEYIWIQIVLNTITIYEYVRNKAAQFCIPYHSIAYHAVASLYSHWKQNQFQHRYKWIICLQKFIYFECSVKLALVNNKKKRKLSKKKKVIPVKALDHLFRYLKKKILFYKEKR